MKDESAGENENVRLHGDLLTVSSRVCHDLRTPLGGIVTAAEVLREIPAGQKQSGAMTQAILDSVDDLTRVIKQVSFITRATANPLPKQPVNMGGIVATALQRQESRIAKKNAVVVQPDSWPRVNGVAEWLEAVWSNFLANALHTRENPRIELSWRQENGWIRFGVSDNGGGVPEELRPTLFQPFDSLHKPGSSRGFGLSIVQRLMELQGGNCGYEPLPDGSFFYFSLPGE